MQNIKHIKHIEKSNFLVLGVNLKSNLRDTSL